MTMFLGVDRQWNGDKYDLTQWRAIQAQSPDRLVVDGNWLAATVLSGDFHSNGARAELVGPSWKEGDNVWYRWQTRFPGWYGITPKWQLLTQFHQISDVGIGVPLHFALHGVRLSMRVMGPTYDAIGDYNGGILWTTEMQRNQEYDFLLNVSWSKDPTKGWVELFVNGTQVVKRTYRATLADDGVYLKQGLYRDRTIDFPQTVYHSGMQTYSELVRYG